MKDLYIQAIFNQYMGARDQARADLETYLSNSVGVGEHSDLGEEIKKKIQEIDKYSSLIATMQSLFGEGSSPSVMPPEESS
jgi:hypothetical protein